MHSKRLARLVASSGVRHMSRAPAVRHKVVPLVKLHDLLDTKAAEPDALVASFKALHRKGVKLPLFFYEKAVELLCQRHDSVRVEYLLRLSRQATVPPESQLLSRPEHDSFEILSSKAIGMLARYGAATKSINLWKNLATADFVANRKSLELILHQLAQSKAISSLELPLNLFKVLQNNGWADGERCLHDLSKVLAIHLRTGCATPEELSAALEHVKELWNEIDKLSYVSLTLQRAKATTSIAAAQAARRLGAAALDSECYGAATQAYHGMLSAIQRPSLHKDAETTKQSSMLQSIFQTNEYASTFRPGHVNSDEDIALLLERPQGTDASNDKTLQASRSTAAVQDQLYGSLVLGQERQELFLSIRRIAEAMCAEHAVRGNQNAAVADLTACMSAFPHGSEVSPLARVAGVGARPGSPAFGFRSLFATSFAEVLAAYQPANARQRHSEELVADINSFARTLLDAMHREHVTPTADFHAAWVRALPVAGDVAIAAAQEVVNDAHPVIRNSPQLLEAQVGFYCKHNDDRLLQKAYDLYHKRASEGVRSVSALTQLIMSAMTSHSPSTLSSLLADATREIERNQWSHVTMAEMGDFLLAQLYGYARLREGYKSLRILTRLQHVATASSAEEASVAAHRPFTIPRKAYQWTLTALCLAEPSSGEEKGIEANPTSTCEWLLQDMLKHGHTCDAQLGASMIKLHTKSCLRRPLSDRAPSFDVLTQFYEQLKRGVLNHPPLGEDLVLVKEFIRAALTCEFEDVAQRALEQRKEAGNLNVELYEPLFYYYATIKKSLNETEDLLAQLTNSGNKPTPAIIDAIAEGYAMAGEVGAAIDWLQESLAQYRVRCTPKGFLRVLEILLENGDADQARRGVGLIASLFDKTDDVAPEESDLLDLYPPLPHVRKGRLVVADLQPATLADLRPECLQRRFRQLGHEL